MFPANPFPARHVLRAVALLIVLFASVNVGAADRPNVLLILPDQMRASAMHCMGNPDALTPNIDRLAADGILMRRTYANTPVCCPARAILMTGEYTHRNGMVANDLRLRESKVTIAEILRDAGYRTGFVGKWHLDGGPRDPGFVPPGERRQGFEFWAAYECHHNHFNPTYFKDTPDVIQVPKFEPEASCNFAIEFLKSQPKSRPFFLTVQMGPPHDPYGAPEEYMKRFDPEKLTLQANWQPNSETGRPRPLAMHLRRPGIPANPFVPTGGREEVAAYYAAISAIDDQVGRLLATLKDTGLDDNTIILFTSDHGDMLGSHGLRRKRKPYDESAHVPGIIRWPARVPKGQAVDTLFSHIDMAPTLLSLCGIPVPGNMQGTDLSRVALGETKEGPDAVLLQIFVPFHPDQITEGWRGLVTADHTYARHKDGPWLLFDDRKDPQQMKNLVDDPSSGSLIKQLDDKLSALMKKHGDDWSFDSDALVEEGGRLYKHGTFYTVQEYLDWAKAHPDVAK